MYAVITTSGKQYKVTENDVLKVDKLDVEVGSVVQFDQVLALRSAGGELRIGSPTVEGAIISAEVIEQRRDEKVIVFKKKRRHNYRRKNGHRQYITVLRILDVSGKGSTEKKAVLKKVAPKVEAVVEEAPAAEKKAPKKAATAKKATSETKATKSASKKNSTAKK